MKAKRSKKRTAKAVEPIPVPRLELTAENLGDIQWLLNNVMGCEVQSVKVSEASGV